ncbi:MAG: DUF222 domain-containing protein [Acidimicrobiia bacterium]|nr:DUF222 domain-containing protein [Acidimicrobiia bacterium]
MTAVFGDTSTGGDADTECGDVTLAEFRAWIRRATPDERAHIIEQCHAITAATQRVMLDTVAAADEAEDWTADGAVDAAHWLLARLKVHARTAHAWAEIAVGMQELPAVAEAFGAGLLTLDQVRVLVRFVTAQTDAVWAQRAQTMTVARLEREARRHEPVTVDDARDAWERRSLRMWWNETERNWEGDFSLPDTLGATLDKAVTRLARQTPLNPLTGRPDPWTARCADALVALAARAIGADPDPDRATVVVQAPFDVFTGERTEVAEIEGGPTIAHETLQRLLCDCRLQTVLVDDDGNPVAFTNTTRQIPPKLARLLRHRDRHCRFPGCTRRAWIQFHHNTPVSQGGLTELAGLTSLCHYHHWHVHEGGWRISGNPNDDLTFTSPTGRRLTSRSPPATPSIERWIRHKLYG